MLSPAEYVSHADRKPSACMGNKQKEIQGIEKAKQYLERRIKKLQRRSGHNGSRKRLWSDECVPE